MLSRAKWRFQEAAARRLPCNDHGDWPSARLRAVGEGVKQIAQLAAKQARSSRRSPSSRHSRKSAQSRGEPFAMLGDLQRKHDWVFKTIRYSSLDRLIETMDDEIIKPAEAKFKQLLARRAEPIEDREV